MLPSSYSETELADYMLAVTQAVSSVLGLTSDSFDEAVNDTLIGYGVEDIAEATDISKLRCLARVFAWRTMVEATAAEHDYSTDTGQSPQYFKRNQIHQNAQEALVRAEKEATEAGYLSVGEGALTSNYAAVTATW